MTARGPAGAVAGRTRGFWRDTSGNSAAEMALMLPLVLLLLFGSFEVGYFMWSEHKVIEAVRNGVRYASRLPMGTICGGGAGSTAAIADVALLTRTGQLASTTAAPIVAGWSSNSQVSVTCGAFVSTGVYSSTGTTGQTISVSATGLSYPSLFKGLGVLNGTVPLYAKASTAVIGV